LNVCWNNVYRKIFRMHQWESVKEIQWFCDRLDFKQIVDKRKLKFFSCVAKSRNSVLQVGLCYALYRHSQEYISLCLKYGVNDGSCSVSAICSAVVILIQLSRCLVLANVSVYFSLLFLLSLSYCQYVCLFVCLTVCFCLSLYVWHVVLP